MKQNPNRQRNKGGEKAGEKMNHYSLTYKKKKEGDRMLKIKKHKFIWLGFIVLGVTLLGMPSVYAQDKVPQLMNDSAFAP